MYFNHLLKLLNVFFISYIFFSYRLFGMCLMKQGSVSWGSEAVSEERACNVLAKRRIKAFIGTFSCGWS